MKRTLLYTLMTLLFSYTTLAFIPLYVPEAPPAPEEPTPAKMGVTAVVEDAPVTVGTPAGTSGDSFTNILSEIDALAASNLVTLANDRILRELTYEDPTLTAEEFLALLVRFDILGSTNLVWDIRTIIGGYIIQPPVVRDELRQAMTQLRTKYTILKSPTDPDIIPDIDCYPINVTHVRLVQLTRPVILSSGALTNVIKVDSLHTIDPVAYTALGLDTPYIPVARLSDVLTLAYYCQIGPLQGVDSLRYSFIKVGNTSIPVTYFNGILRLVYYSPGRVLNLTRFPENVVMTINGVPFIVIDHVVYTLMSDGTRYRMEDLLSNYTPVHIRSRVHLKVVTPSRQVTQSIHDWEVVYGVVLDIMGSHGLKKPHQVSPLGFQLELLNAKIRAKGDSWKTDPEIQQEWREYWTALRQSLDRRHRLLK